MRSSDWKMREKKEKLSDKRHREAINNIYQWVKEDRLTPAQMEELVRFVIESEKS
jgi:hypothetical protein